MTGITIFKGIRRCIANVIHAILSRISIRHPIYNIRSKNMMLLLMLHYFRNAIYPNNNTFPVNH